MILVAALCSGLAIYLWTAHQVSWNEAGWMSVGLWPAWLIHPQMNTGLALGAMTLGFVLSRRPSRPQGTAIRRKRRLLVRFWRIVSFFLTAGMTFWQAIDQALAVVPELDGAIRELVQTMLLSRFDLSAMEAFRREYPGPESDVIATMLLHGYHHGIAPDDAMKQASEMEEQLSLEEALRRQSHPMLLTILPALLLLNVLALFGAPMGLLALHSWTVVRGG